MPNTATIHARPDERITLERTDSDREDETSRNIAALAGVDLEPARNADICGALGCRESVQLIRGVIEGFGQRVLCAEHMSGLIRREVLDDE